MFYEYVKSDYLNEIVMPTRDRADHALRRKGVEVLRSKRSLW